MLIQSIDLRENQIFNRLSQSELEEIIPHLELTVLTQSEVLYEKDEKIDYIYFPVAALVSLQNCFEDGSTAEIEMVGKEGFLDISFILNKKKAFSQAVVTHSGHAYKIYVEALTDLLTRSGGRRASTLKTLLFEYAQTFLGNVSQISSCNCRHNLEQRFSRWLLSSFNCLGSNSLSITHEAISYLLGVRRESITELARKFHLNGTINNRRGNIELKNIQLLEHRACECSKIMHQVSTAI